MGQKKPKILIVGAGPTGLTTGLELARRGIIPTIIESRTAPSPLSRAVGILPSSMEIFERSGVAEHIRQKAISIKKANFHKGAQLCASLQTDILQPSHLRIYALPQDQTEKILKQNFEAFGGKVIYGSPLEKLSQDETGVSATIKNKKKKFDYVIGADGIRSTVRTEVGLSYEGYELAQEWSIADFETEHDFGGDHFNIFLLEEGKGALLIPLEHKGGLYRFRAVSSTDDALSCIPVDIGLAKINRIASFKIKIAQVERYQKGRVFLAGDAAHCHSPVGGRGMNLGISDAADLAERFVEGGLEGYHDARHQEGLEIIRTTERARKFVFSKSRWNRTLLLFFLKIGTSVPFLERRIVRGMLGG